MRVPRTLLLTLFFCCANAVSGSCASPGTADSAEFQYKSAGIEVPAASADEPRVVQFGPDTILAAAQYLDDGAHYWVREKSCVACHSTGVYLVERSALTAWLGRPSEEVHAYFAASIPDEIGRPVMRDGAKYYSASIQSVWRSSGLAAWDKNVTGTLSESTDKSLRHTLKCFADQGFVMTFPQVEIPYITTDFELTVQAARAMATAPGWLQSVNDEASLQCIERMKTFLQEHLPVNDYEHALKLQLANLYPDLISAAQTNASTEMLWRQQLSDGGWSTRRMSDLMKWHVNMDPKVVSMIQSEPDADAPGSDPYMTAFAIVLLREAGVPADDSRIQRGVHWLKTNQRVSGRWWMKSLYRDTKHYSTYISTAQVLRALALCDELPLSPPLADKSPQSSESVFQAGVAETDITPPEGFPMAGYYHERLAEGIIDPLKARAFVMKDDDNASVLVVCDLIGIATDLSKEVRRKASQRTGIPESNIVLAATHSHTAPDYMKELWLKLEKQPQDELRGAYIETLISKLTDVITDAVDSAQPAVLQYGAAVQQKPVSFNRRFVMRDGSVKTWQSLDNPEVVRTAGPVDPEIGIVSVQDSAGKLKAVLSNFALHLDTVGGMKWSADYPFFIERTVQASVGADVVSIFGTGCCGDINHVNPASRERNTASIIGSEIGASITQRLPALNSLTHPTLVVKSAVVRLPLQDATRDEVDQSIEILNSAGRKEKVDFFEHVTAYKKLMLDQMRHAQPFAKTQDQITWGLSRSLAGVGDKLPVDVTVMTVGQELAIVCLPGEVFVELGLAIKQGSPFRQTLVIELCNAVETIYIPNRGAYAGGSYEVTNSATMPGSGEMLVEAALTLLRDAAEEQINLQAGRAEQP